MTTKLWRVSLDIDGKVFNQNIIDKDFEEVLGLVRRYQWNFKNVTIKSINLLYEDIATPEG